MYKEATYQVVNEEKQPVKVHFETSGEQVKFFDEGMNELGSVQTLLMNGVRLTGDMADIKRVKYSGLYLVGSDMKNPPIDIPVDKTAILQSTAVGEKGKPDFIHFKFIHPDGHIFDNTVVGTKESGWTNGGKTLKEELDTLNKNVDTNTSNIKTNTENISKLGTRLDTAEKNLKDHNHDSTYLKLSGGRMTGDLGLQYGGSFKFVSAQGEEKNFASYSVENGATLGDDTVALDIRSKNNISHNGKKVWSETNHGKGSGLDSDKLHGVSGSEFAQKNEVNNFTQDQKISNGKSLIFEDDSIAEGVVWKSKNGDHRASIKSDRDGRILFHQKDGNVITKIDSDGHIVTKRGMYLDSSSVEGHVVFQLSDTDKGMGFYRNNGSKYLGIYNWAKGERIGYFHPDEGYFHMDKAPSITGRRLYMQGDQPKGKTVGDIWIS